jgi:hypothetical protein
MFLYVTPVPLVSSALYLNLQIKYQHQIIIASVNTFAETTRVKRQK